MVGQKHDEDVDLAVNKQPQLWLGKAKSFVVGLVFILCIIAVLLFLLWLGGKALFWLFPSFYSSSNAATAAAGIGFWFGSMFALASIIEAFRIIAFIGESVCSAFKKKVTK